MMHLASATFQKVLLWLNYAKCRSDSAPSNLILEILKLNQTSRESILSTKDANIAMTSQVKDFGTQLLPCKAATKG